MFKKAFEESTETLTNERYWLAYKELDNLKVGITVLNPKQETRGHEHDGIDEVYFFVSGEGLMINGDTILPVQSGSVVLIPSGNFHRVINSADSELQFVVAFNKVSEKNG